MKYVKSVDLFLFEQKSLKDNFLNEDLTTVQPWINKIMNENSIKGLSLLLSEMDNSYLNEGRLWDKVKNWGEQKLNWLKRKYQEVLDSETFKKVKAFWDNGEELPTDKKELEKFKKENPKLYTALETIENEESPAKPIKDKNKF